MLQGKKIIVVLPAYNAAKTLEKTYQEIPHDIVDEVILVDDFSRDDTVAQAKRLGITTFEHDRNKGYGGNQKNCYKEALKRNADIVVMLHPDYQYPPKAIMSMASLIAVGMFDVVLGSRILGRYALKGGMPYYKYFSNRVLTAFENLLISQKLSEYHTGYRAFSKEVLSKLPLTTYSDDFIFDNQMLAEILYEGFRVGEVSTPSIYTKESSSINFRRSMIYGFGVLGVSFKYFIKKRFVWGHVNVPSP